MLWREDNSVIASCSRAWIYSLLNLEEMNRPLFCENPFPDFMELQVFSLQQDHLPRKLGE